MQAFIGHVPILVVRPVLFKTRHHDQLLRHNISLLNNPGKQANAAEIVMFATCLRMLASSQVSPPLSLAMTYYLYCSLTPKVRQALIQDTSSSASIY